MCTTPGLGQDANCLGCLHPHYTLLPMTGGGASLQLRTCCALL